MRKYVFAGDWVLEQAVGVQRYTYQILLELDKMILSGAIEYDIEMLVPQNNKWVSPFKKIKVIAKGKIYSKIDKYKWQQLTFPLYVIKNKAIGIDMAGALPIWGCRICALHDCIKEAFPENFGCHSIYLKLYYIRAKLVTNSKKVHIVTLSNDSKSEVQKYYHVTDDRIDVVTCGWEHMKYTSTDDAIFNKLDFEMNDNYFFSLGSKYKHKNFKWVIAAAEKNPHYKFVITGTGIFSNNEGELKRDVPSNVIFTGYISNEEIKSLMFHCRALIQPSLYEGFGLPPLEALSVGKRIIVSSQSSLPEIYKKSAYYIDPFSDGCDLDDLLDGEVEDPKEILREYSWKHAAEQLLYVIEKID